MSSFKNWTSAVTVLVLILAFTGCGGDDDGGRNNSGNGNVVNNSGNTYNTYNSSATPDEKPGNSSNNGNSGNNNVNNPPVGSSPTVTVVNNSSFTDAFKVNGTFYSLASYGSRTLPYSGSLSFYFDTLAGYFAPLPANGDDGEDITVTISNGSVPGTVTAVLDSNARFIETLGL